MPSFHVFIAFGLIITASGASFAAEPVPDVSALDPSCACVARGKRYAQGETACINGLRMTCGMSQNNTSWLGQGEQCQVSKRMTETKPKLSVAAQ